MMFLLLLLIAIGLLCIQFPRSVQGFATGVTSISRPPHHPSIHAIAATEFVEPDNSYGRLGFWDLEYEQSNNGTKEDTFSWYCNWGELEPFFSEVVAVGNDPKILIPGIGNDACIRDMFDSGYRHITAFDYAPEGVECARRMLGPERLTLIDDLRVADCRDLPYEDGSFDAVLEKGTLDSIYLSGGRDKDISRKHLALATSELTRITKIDGIVFSVTAACADSVQKSFDAYNSEHNCWEQIRNGDLWMTDGFASNNVDATMLVWKKRV